MACINVHTQQVATREIVLHCLKLVDIQDGGVELGPVVGIINRLGQVVFVEYPVARQATQPGRGLVVTVAPHRVEIETGQSAGFEHLRGRQARSACTVTLPGGLGIPVGVGEDLTVVKADQATGITD